MPLSIQNKYIDLQNSTFPILSRVMINSLDNHIKAVLKKIIKNEDDYDIWIKPIKLVPKQNKLTITLPNRFFKEWIQSNCIKQIMETAKKRYSEITEVQFIVKDPGRHIDKKNQVNIPKRHDGNSSLNNKYRFDNFIVGDSNRFASAAAIAVATNPGTAYNPFYIYGGVGLGKTHLLQAIGHRVAKDKKKKICYISSEQFTNELIDAIKRRDNENFRHYYRNLDLLLIDDIQFIAGKHGTQEEFFNTFNALHQVEGQIVITSDKLPRDIDNIEERLRSRFQWGLIAEIGPPDYETRVAIINKKAKANNLDINEDVADFLASKITSNVREIEGALIRIGAFSSLMNANITLNFAKEILSGILLEKKRQITVENIQKAVAGHFNITVSKMLSKRREKEILKPRQIAIYLVRKLTGKSYSEICRHFGMKSHASVINAVKTIESESDKNQIFSDEIKIIHKKISS